MEIEDLIDSKSRLKQGIFFTKHHIVEIINSNFDFRNVSAVVDSAAGSCNFLIPLAKKYKDIQFYGVEKNHIIYDEVSKIVESYHNIHYFLGDMLLDKLPIPKCDIYIGNPPFINYSDLDSEYREQIKPIWLEIFPKSKGFKMLLGDSRGDIAQLIFSYTVENYLRDGGEIGVILPNSLIKGNSASAGFREFSNIQVDTLNDISHDDPFDNTNRNCFYLLGKKGGSTSYPVTYRTAKRDIKLLKVGDDLIEEGTSILKESMYIARQGVNTLGANKIFIFKGDVPFSSEIIKPLLKSSDINQFSYSPSYSILFPYKNGKPIPEDELKSSYPEEYDYLVRHKEILENRKSRFIKKCWYALFGVGEYTAMEYKVVWRGLGAKKLVASVTEDIIPNQAMNCYISTQSKDEAYFVCGVINSTLFRDQLMLLNEEGAKSFAQPNTVNKIFIPKYDPLNNIHLKIEEYSSKLHVEYIDNLYSKLDGVIKELYIQEGFLSSP